MYQKIVNRFKSSLYYSTPDVVCLFCVYVLQKNDIEVSKKCSVMKNLYLFTFLQSRKKIKYKVNHVYSGKKYFTKAC